MDDDEVKPVPDPSRLTTEQMLREVGNVERLLDARLQTIEAVMDERFNSVATQLGLSEQQRLEQKADTKDRVDTAMAAAEKAVREQTISSEKAIGVGQQSTAEQLKQTNITLSTVADNLTGLVNDLKTRVERIENIKQGGNEQVNDARAVAAQQQAVAAQQRASTAQMIAIVVAVLAFISLVAAIVLPLALRK